jgi:tRNA pseudouridine38-40 synthase
VSKHYRYFIKLSYNGRSFNGWQIQKNAPSIQEEVNYALSLLLKSKIDTTGCGRTDAGVHALVFFAHFDLDTQMETKELQIIVGKLNSMLHQDILIHEIVNVGNNANARHDVIMRTYKYQIITQKDPFKIDNALFYPGKLDLDLMNQCSGDLMNFRDFTSFSKLHSSAKTNICKINSAKWEKSNHLMVFTISADRFLRNMVRAIVGTLIDAGRGKISRHDFSEIIESKNRSNAGYSVPAKGLFLTGVQYPEHIELLINPLQNQEKEV